MAWPFGRCLITDEASQDLEVAVDLARSFDLEAIEIRNIWGRGPHEWTPDEVRHIGDVSQSANLKVCCITPPFFKCELDDDREVARHLDILRASCDVAHRLNVGLVRGFAFWRHGPLDAVKGKVVRQLEKAARIVESEGLTLALENEYTTNNNNVQRTLELMDAVGSPNLGLIFDPGNDVHEPEGELPWPDAYDMARPRMVHMHLKDPYRDKETGQVYTGPIGKGDTYVPETMAALVESGYDGYISLETHYVEEPTPAEVEALPETVRPSAGAWLASRDCLDRWMAILNDL